MDTNYMNILHLAVLTDCLAPLGVRPEVRELFGEVLLRPEHVQGEVVLDHALVSTGDLHPRLRGLAVGVGQEGQQQGRGDVQMHLGLFRRDTCSDWN